MTNYYYKYLKYKQKYSELKNIGGSVEKVIINKDSPQVLKMLSEFNLNDVEPTFSLYKIMVDGNYYNSWSDIPHEIYSSITNLSLYNFISTVTEENLRAFIIFRLLSKLYYNDQEIILKSENDIRRLYSNERFIELFIDFLNKQAFASILPNIENEILDHSRPTEETNEWGYKKRTGTPLLNKEIRQLNMIYLKTITESADIAWIKLIEHIKTIMPENY